MESSRLFLELIAAYTHSETLCLSRGQLGRAGCCPSVDLLDRAAAVSAKPPWLCPGAAGDAHQQPASRAGRCCASQATAAAAVRPPAACCPAPLGSCLPQAPSSGQGPPSSQNVWAHRCAAAAACDKCSALLACAPGLPPLAAAACLTLRLILPPAGSVFWLGLSIFAILFLSVLASLINNGYPYAGAARSRGPAKRMPPPRSCCRLVPAGHSPGGQTRAAHARLAPEAARRSTHPRPPLPAAHHPSSSPEPACRRVV